MKLDRLLSEYAERFRENFPVFTMLGTSEDELIAILQKCMIDNEPYRFEDDGKIDY